MSAQPPIITGFQFDSAPIERGISTLIRLLDALQNSASRAIGVVQGSGASVGGSAQEVSQFGAAISNLDANVGRIATTLQGFENRVEGIVNRLLQVPGAADQAGNALGNLPSLGGAPPPPVTGAPGVGAGADIVARQRELTTAEQELIRTERELAAATQARIAAGVQAPAPAASEEQLRRLAAAEQVETQALQARVAAQDQVTRSRRALDQAVVDGAFGRGGAPPPTPPPPAGGGGAAGGADQFPRLTESRARLSSELTRFSQAEAAASGETTAADKRRVSSLLQVESALDKVEQRQKLVLRAETLLANAPNNSKQQAAAAELLTRLYDQQSSTLETLGQKTISAARTDQTLRAKAIQDAQKETDAQQKLREELARVNAARSRLSGTSAGTQAATRVSQAPAASETGEVRRTQAVAARIAAENKLTEVQNARLRAEAAVDASADQSTARQARANQLLAGRLNQEVAARESLNQKLLTERQAHDAVTAGIEKETAARDKAREKQAQSIGQAEIQRDKDIAAQAEFLRQKPLRVQGAEADVVQARAQEAKATLQVAAARETLTAAEKRGATPQQQQSAANALVAALKAEEKGAEATAAARRTLEIARKSSSSPQDVKNANDLAKGYKETASAALANASAHNRLAQSLKPVSQASGDAHNNLLALLGVSRLLPGALGQALSGFALLEGGARSASGVLIASVGAAAALVTQYIRLGGETFEFVNRLRAQSEGLGLTAGQTLALDSIMKQTGQTVNELAVGLGNLREGISGIGPNAARVRTALLLAFGPDFQTEGKTSFEILRLLIGRLVELKDQSSELANIIPKLIFGRKFDDFGQSLRDLNAQLDEAVPRMEKLNQTQKEGQKQASDYERQVQNLSVAWREFLITIKAPAVAKFVLEVVTKLTGGVDSKGGGLSFADQIVNTVRAQFGLGVPGQKFDARGQLIKPVPAGTGVTGSGEFEPTAKTAAQIRQKSTTLQEEIALRQQGASREKLILLKETERDLIKKEASASREALEQVNEAVKAGDQTVERLEVKKESDKLINDAIATAGNIVKARNQLLDKTLDAEARAAKIEKEIAALKKKGTAAAVLGPLQLRREELLQKARELPEKFIEGFKPTPEFQSILDQVKTVNKQISAAIEGLDEPSRTTERLKATTQAFRDRFQLNKEGFTEELRQFQDHLNEIQTLAQEKVSDIHLAQQETSIRTRQALEAGTIGVREAASADAQAILNILDRVKAGFEEQKSAIAGAIQGITDLKAAGGIDVATADKAVQNLEKRRRAINVQTTKEEARTANERLQIDDRTRDRIIANRQILLEVEIRTQEEVNKRRLVLIERAAKDSVIIQRQAIEQAAADELQIIEAQKAKIANEFRDRAKLVLKPVVDSKNLPSLLNTLGAGDAETFRQIGLAINTAITQNIDGSQELLAIYQKLLELFEREKTIRQETGVKLTDNQVASAQRLLDIRRQEIDIAGEILSIEEQRNQFLDQEGLITNLQANENRVDIERRKLALIQQQARELERQGDLVAAEKAERQVTKQAGAPITREQILEIQASPEVGQLNAELVRLKGDALAASDRLALLDSVLGRLSRAFGDLEQIAAQASDKFPGLALIFKGAKALADALLGKQLQAKSPAEEIKDASTQFRTGIANAAVNFKSIIEQAAQAFKTLVTTPAEGSTALTVGGKPVTTGVSTKGAAAAVAAGEDDGSTVSLVKQIISKAATVAGGIISGLSATSIGGKIAGFSSALAVIPGIGGIIASVGQIVGGVADFIGAGFRKRAEKIATDIQDNMKLITEKLRDGSISLGEAISSLQKGLESARAQLGSGKIGKKGGRAALKQIEQQTADQIKQLREQAKHIQEGFIKSLDTLRLAPELRSIASAVDDAEQKLKEFLGSFETGAEALKHFGEAEQFLALTIKDLKATATDQLNSVIKREQEARLAFEQSRQSIINQGRVTSPFDAAQDRLQALFELERRRAEERAAAESEEAKLQKQISFIDQSFQKASDVIDKMRASFDSLVSGLGQIFGTGGGGGIGSFSKDGGLGIGSDSLNSILRASTSARPSAVDLSGTLSIALSVSGLPAGAQIQVGGASLATRERLGLVSRISINPARPLA